MEPVSHFSSNIASWFIHFTHIINPGLHGLAMAKTFLQVHPNGKLLVVDQAKSVGGSWAKERLYPGLKTNNVFGSSEFGDFPMVPERYGACLLYTSDAADEEFAV